MNIKDSIAINLIQHYLFCERQWALMVLEDTWSENADTIKGHDLHDKAHDINFTEKRGNKIITRGLPIYSRELGIHGVTDVVEYHKDPEGIKLVSFEGNYTPYIVEYKKGKPKLGNEDIMQLVAQVICIEEMHDIKIRESAIYYKQINKRLIVEISEDLRFKLKNIITNMRELFLNTNTPKAKKRKKCNKCSLIEFCWPRLTTHKRSVVNYIEEHIEVII